MTTTFYNLAQIEIIQGTGAIEQETLKSSHEAIFMHTNGRLCEQRWRRICCLLIVIDLCPVTHAVCCTGPVLEWTSCLLKSIASGVGCLSLSSPRNVTTLHVCECISAGGLMCLCNRIEVTFFFSPLKKHLCWPQTADRNKNLRWKDSCCVFWHCFLYIWCLDNIACIKHFELLLWNRKLSEREGRMKRQINETDGRKDRGRTREKRERGRGVTKDTESERVQCNERRHPEMGGQSDLD